MSGYRNLGTYFPECAIDFKRDNERLQDAKIKNCQALTDSTLELSTLVA